MKRKRPLLKNEIEMIQIILWEEAYPTKEYRFKLAERLEELKERWYKVKKSKEKKNENNMAYERKEE